MRKQLRNDVVEWNSKFPVDRWWRERHNIPYMSTAHKEANFIDMLFEFEEEMLMNNILDSDSNYEPNIGKWLCPSNQTFEQKVSSLADETRAELAKFNKQENAG